MWFFAVAAWISSFFLHLLFQRTARTIVASATLVSYRAGNPVHDIGYRGDDDGNDDDDFHGGVQIIIMFARTLLILLYDDFVYCLADIVDYRAWLGIILRAVWVDDGFQS